MDKITLHQFPRCDWGIPNESPFCMKLECVLRMLGLPYDLRTFINPKEAPNGKVPYLEINGQIMGDSGQIVRFLQDKYNDPIDKTLTEEEKAESLLVQRTLEEHLYWAIVYSRWFDPIGFKLFSAPLIEMMGSVIGHLVIWKVKRAVKKELWYQGLVRHPAKQMYALCVDDLKAVSQKLGDKAFYFGETPHMVDACLYAHFAAILYQPWPTPLNDYLVTQTAVIQYTERMAKRYFDDLPKPSVYRSGSKNMLG